MATTQYVLRLTVRRIIPFGLVVGAGMETFMYFTGFWKTATKNAGEREQEAKQGRADARSAREARSARVHSSLGLGSPATSRATGEGEGVGGSAVPRDTTDHR